MPSGYDNLDPLFHGSSEVGIDRHLAGLGLKHFVEMAWHIAEPSCDFIPNWHIDAICDHLQAVQEGHIKRLIINVPPGSTKSLSCCVLFPGWSWTQTPQKKFIFSGNADSVVMRDANANLRLIKSDWYQERWGDLYSLVRDPASEFTNDQGGFRKSTTVKGAITGWHADIQLTDDPLKPLEVTKTLHVSQTAIEEVLTWWNQTMSSRLVSLKDSARIIIMQRLVDNDLAGEMLKTGDYEHLMLPQEFEPHRKCVTGIGWEDPRTEEKELLCEERFPVEAVDTAKKELGSRGYQAQHQQNPISEEGSIIKRQWAQFYQGQPSAMTFQTMIQSWDCTFKDTDGTDFVVGQVWGIIKEQYYLVDQIRARMDLVDTCKALLSMTLKWPKARTKIIEDKANGPAVVSTLKKKVSGMILVNPEGGKIARAYAVEPLWESGNVFLPLPEYCPWIDGVDSFLEEVTGFPARAHDDQVDAMTQALIYLQAKRMGIYRQAMQKVK
jgi:predicted phage terminase large subunit-like protein